MTKGKAFVLVFLIMISVLAAAFLCLFTIVKIPVEVGKPLKLPGETYLLVKKPGITDPLFVNIGEHMNSTVWGSIANLLTLRSVEIPWYMNRDYISGHVFFCYNTEAGVVTDKSFFEKPFRKM